MLKKNFDTNRYGKNVSLLQILTYGNGELNFGIDTLEILAVDKLSSNISIREDLKNGIITLNVHSFEPKLASEINWAIIDGLDSHQRMYNQNKSSDTRKFIEERILDTEKELVLAEEELKNFMDRNRRIGNSPSLQLQQQRLTREVTVLTEVFTTLKQQLETTKIEEVKESDYVIIIDEPIIPLKDLSQTKD